MITKQTLDFLRSNLPYGERYEIDGLVLSRDELVGYLLKSIVDGDKDYQVCGISVVGVGEFEVVLTNGVLRIDHIILDDCGRDYDWIPYAVFEIR